MLAMLQLQFIIFSLMALDFYAKTRNGHFLHALFHSDNFSLEPAAGLRMVHPWS